ncbi:MAG TPA: hypothetical protein VF486_23890 [Actinomycetes bacterium]
MERTRRPGDERHRRSGPNGRDRRDVGDPPGGQAQLGEALILGLQRSAGNSAVAHALRRGGARPVAGSGSTQGAPLSVQRHSSFEHTLLGNTPPKQLGDAAVTAKDRAHLLQELWVQTAFFARDAGLDPRSRFPNVRWIQLRASGLWVSYGELNSLADYLPENVDGLARNVVEPVLQRMRRGTSAQLGRREFKGQASGGFWETPAAYLDVFEVVATEKGLDRATASLGAQRYFGLVSRNACHFAPYSWHRWARFHEEATGHALAFYHGNQNKQVPIKDIDTSVDEHLRQAWLSNGYGDHYLQDSFAAGHLINKTLVMQWFVDYVNGLSSKWWDLLGRMWWGDDTKPWYGMPDDQVMATMGTRQQPHMAGQNLYERPTSAGTTSMDRDRGEAVTDPQTALERGSHEQRVAGSGVNATTSYTREQNYQAYLRFLNSSFLQLAAGMTHDYLNERGLVVGNDRGDTLHVGGDSTLLTKSGRLGATVAAEAAQMSQRAIDELSRTGTTEITVERISALFPTKVWASAGSDGTTRPLPLEEWQDEVLHQLCLRKIFPDVVDSWNSKAARAGQSELVEGGVRDQPTPPPVPTNLGDFVLLTGGRNVG